MRAIPKILKSGLRLKPKKRHRKLFLNFHRRYPERGDGCHWFTMKMAAVVINGRFKVIKFSNCACIQEGIKEIRSLI